MTTLSINHCVTYPAAYLFVCLDVLMACVALRTGLRSEVTMRGAGPGLSSAWGEEAAGAGGAGAGHHKPSF